MQPNKQITPQYFNVLNALKKGGLSLWLNRRILSSMLLLPVIITFITLAVAQANMGDGLSPFMLALIQIPADFITGIFCALIIVIVVNAPKKREDGKPVMFSLNIMDKKKVMVAGAIAHVVFSYLSSGLYGVMDLLMDELHAAAQNEEPLPMQFMLPLILLLAIGLYSVRFLYLPILVIADMEIKPFFKRYKAFSFSMPIFLTKFGTTIALGLGAYMIMSVVLMGKTPEDDLTLIQSGILDFVTAIASVLATAWAYASLCVGFREMMERKG